MMHPEEFTARYSALVRDYELEGKGQTITAHMIFEVM
jgi:hypothetical protein